MTQDDEIGGSEDYEIHEEGLPDSMKVEAKSVINLIAMGFYEVVNIFTMVSNYSYLRGEVDTSIFCFYLIFNRMAMFFKCLNVMRHRCMYFYLDGFSIAFNSAIFVTIVCAKGDHRK